MVFRKTYLVQLSSHLQKKKTKVNSALRSSTAFFQQLQERTQTSLKKLSTKNKKTKDDAGSTNKAKKLKL